ncbi:uncharacterized protein VTP21DRAFT_7534 [Calcarisporiella thermophila]|uniref:uncharacterized protein n=1 Tax=Calcarisporiella thermophila TaxID=911321 RepID=UPI003744A065
MPPTEYPHERPDVKQPSKWVLCRKAASHPALEPKVVWVAPNVVASKHQLSLSHTLQSAELLVVRVRPMRIVRAVGPSADSGGIGKTQLMPWFFYLCRNGVTSALCPSFGVSAATWQMQIQPENSFQLHAWLNSELGASLKQPNRASKQEFHRPPISI